VKYSSRHHKLKTPRKPLNLNKKKLLKYFTFSCVVIGLVWGIMFTNLLKIQSSKFNFPSNFNCSSVESFNGYDRTGQSIILFNTRKLEEEIEKNPCIESAFVELSPNRILNITITQTRPIASLFISPKLEEINKIASSSVDLRSATVSAILESSQLVDTNKDLNSRLLLQNRVSTESSLPKFIIPEKQKSDNYTDYKIKNVLDCLTDNLIQTTSFLIINQNLNIYFINVNNGFTTLDAKLFVSPITINEKFCPALQEIIQKSTIDGIKLDSIDLRFKDPVVNIKK